MSGYLSTRLESIRSALGLIVAGCSLLMLIGGIASKSTRWTDISNGSGMRWTDGVKPWAVWSFLGAVMILGLFYLALRNGWWILLGGASAMLFWRAGIMAAEYKREYEAADLSAIYDHQSTALGLYLVPIGTVIGSVCAVLLLLVSLSLIVKDRRTSHSLARI